jgi:hypothetical protein
VASFADRLKKELKMLDELTLSLLLAFSYIGQDPERTLIRPQLVAVRSRTLPQLLVKFDCALSRDKNG